MKPILRAHLAIAIFHFSILNSSASHPFENYYKKWYFGNHSGIDFFNNNSPVVISSSAMTTYDYGSAICNSAGNMLFYTNGVTVWDSTNSMMSNGNNLSGSVTGGQTAMILRINNEDNLYYIFTVPEFASANGFRYSVVDMGLNGGRGEVVLKNQLLFAPSSEKIAAVYNQTDNYYWVISHKWGNNTFAAYKLTTNGLDTIPVLSSVGHINQGGTYGNAHDACGEISISPDGHRIACAYNYSALIELYDFDINTGVIANPVTLTNVSYIWGVEFSPDSKKLYSAKWTQTEVAQYDLTVNTAAAIVASKIVVGNVPYSGSYACGYLELAPDGKIYIAKWNGTSLSEIDSPDSSGALCGFTNNGFNLSGGVSQCGLSASPVFPPNTNDVPSISSYFHNAIFPNPVTHHFILKIPDGFDNKSLVLRIINISGMMVESKAITERETIIYRNEMDPGIYICELINDGKLIAADKLVIE